LSLWQVPLSSITVYRLIKLQLPFWALVSFGAYLLFKLGWGVFTFNDVPEAHKELMTQISQARAELSAKGVDVGSD
jgi:dolichyl-phosphate mannosyltransferase polypeptide 3